MRSKFLGFERWAGESWKQALYRAERCSHARRLSCGWRHTVLSRLDNQVVVMGHGGSGRLGFDAGPIQRVSTPRRLLDISPIQEVSAAVNHTLLLSNDGKVLSCGYDFCVAATDNPDNENGPSVPRLIAMPCQTRIATIATGSMHSAAVRQCILATRVVAPENSEVCLVIRSQTAASYSLGGSVASVSLATATPSPNSCPLAWKVCRQSTKCRVEGSSQLVLAARVIYGPSVPGARHLSLNW